MAYENMNPRQRRSRMRWLEKRLKGLKADLACQLLRMHANGAHKLNWRAMKRAREIQTQIYELGESLRCYKAIDKADREARR